MRLDIFLPHARKRGRFRRLLRRVGQSFESSPWRRLVQVACFALFLWLFFYACWPYGARPAEEASAWASHQADELAAREWVEAESFLALDPLVAISTAIAGRVWVWSLAWAAVVLLVCVIVPRAFCGYVCPLGTLIDLFDGTIGKRVQRFRLRGEGPLGLKTYVLVATLLAAVGGAMVAGFVAAIPVITRGLLFTVAPLQIGLLRGWHQVPPLGVGHGLSIALFVGVLALGLLRPRFWCRCLCPTGAVFTLLNRLRLTERKVTSACVDCHRCVEVCPFDAIQPDYHTRAAECTLCQTCGGVCPTGAIVFTGRTAVLDGKPVDEDAAPERPLSRRGFVAGTVSGAAAALGVRLGFGADLAQTPADQLPVRPPMSVPEADFLRLCIRCGECFQACPNDVLQPLGFEQGLEGLWTPRVAGDWSGCEPSCNNCGQVCPTGAIRALPLEEKRHARMGLAVVDRKTCLPWAQRAECQLCVDECEAAGYRALEFERVGVEVDADGMPVEGTGYLAPVLIPDRCVGCALCQSACFRIQVRHEQQLEESAIVVRAGPGREDRLSSGSYAELRESERRQREEERRQREAELLDDFEWDADDE